jgi:hypothetical protein
VAREKVISHKDFVRDLARGSIGEDIAEVFFEREFDIRVENKSIRNPDWDLIVVGVSDDLIKKPKRFKERHVKKFKKKFGETVEVKFDEAASRHKNLFVEVLFDADRGVAGTTTKCKADLLAWVVPTGRRKFKVYLLKRPEFLAWLMLYFLENKKKLKLKVPGISPKARGVPVPIKDIVDSFACLGEYTFKL